MSNIVDVLKERCLFDNMTSPDLAKTLDSQATVYIGFDPTSESLQIGNYVSIMALANFQRCGHKVIALVGGATGMIGDPSGKSAERKLLGEEDIERNVVGIRENLSRFLDFNDKKATAKIVNNYDWFKGYSYISFLRDIGKHFRVGAMLGKESVRARMESEEGISYTEFSYQLLQAYDFLNLYDKEGCTVQAGGSDQWGNITAGTDLIRKLRGVEAYGITIPLVCDSSGQKFGKTAGNAIYLSSKKTSCYDFYQYFIRVEDSDVIRFLKILTFLPLKEIAELEKEVTSAPEKRIAQKLLAEEVTRTVHGNEGLQVALKASAVLFGESMDGMKADELLGIFSNVPSKELKKADVKDVSFLDLCVTSGLTKSKGEARRLLESGGLYVNNRKVSGIDSKVSGPDMIDGKVIVLRSGKKNFHIVKLV